MEKGTLYCLSSWALETHGTGLKSHLHQVLAVWSGRVIEILFFDFSLL